MQKMGTKKVTLALTSGDPAGIGPELCASLRHADFEARILVLGDAVVFARHGIVDCVSFASIQEAPAEGVVFVDCGELKHDVALAVASREGGLASFRYIERAIVLASSGVVDGIVTAPINKYALNMADISYLGHTEIFADYTKSPKVAMLLYGAEFSVALVTLHVSLRHALDSLSTDAIVMTGGLMHEKLSILLGRAPRLCMLGLNPHAGEQGLFGEEEKVLIEPAVEALRRAGIDISAPLPPDTAFTRSNRKCFDGYLCHYHDQGLIPFKALCFDEGVNITMGIPFPRVSVDHGTAYDIAGKGIASATSLHEAINVAIKLCRSGG